MIKISDKNKERLENLVSKTKSLVEGKLSLYSGGVFGAGVSSYFLDANLDLLSLTVSGVIASEVAKKALPAIEKAKDLKNKTYALGTTGALIFPFAEQLLNLKSPIETMLTKDYINASFTNSLENLGIMALAGIGGIALDKLKPKLGKRSFNLVAASLLTCGLYTGLVDFEKKQENTKGYSIEYFYNTKGAGKIPANKEVVHRILGREVNRNLEYGILTEEDEQRVSLIYNRKKQDKTRAISINKKHGRMLKDKGFFIESEVVDNSRYQKLWKASFGKSKSRKRLQKLSKIIEERINEPLLLERTEDGQYVLTTESFWPKHVAEKKEREFERDLFGAYGSRKEGRVALTLERHRYFPSDNSSIKFESSNLNPVDKIQRIFLGELKAISEFRPDKVDLGITVYSHDLERVVIDYDSKKARQLASTQKLPIAILYQEAVTTSRLDLSIFEKIGNYITMAKMLIPSSNEASVQFVESLGGPKFVENMFKELYPDFSKGFKFEEYIPDHGKDNGRTYKNQADVFGLTLMQAAIYDKNLRVPDMNDFILLCSRFSNAKLKDESFPMFTKFYGKSGTTGEASNIVGTVSLPKSHGGTTYSIGIMMQRNENVGDEYGKWVNDTVSYLQKINAAAYKSISTENNRD